MKIQLTRLNLYSLYSQLRVFRLAQSTNQCAKIEEQELFSSFSPMKKKPLRCQIYKKIPVPETRLQICRIADSEILELEIMNISS